MRAGPCPTGHSQSHESASWPGKSDACVRMAQQPRLAMRTSERAARPSHRRWTTPCAALTGAVAADRAFFSRFCLSARIAVPSCVTDLWFGLSLPGTRARLRSRRVSSFAPRHSPAAQHARLQTATGRPCVTATAATAPAPAPSEARSPAEAPQPPPGEGLRIPRCLAEIDNGKILGFGADLAEDHPVRFLACASASARCSFVLPCTVSLWTCGHIACHNVVCRCGCLPGGIVAGQRLGLA